MQRFLPVLLGVIGAVEALLLARLVLRLFAARPDNPAFSTLFALTWPLVAPFAALDAGQPKFGAVLELSTLALCAIIAAIIILLALVGRVRPRRGLANRP